MSPEVLKLGVPLTSFALGLEEQGRAMDLIVHAAQRSATERASLQASSSSVANVEHPSLAPEFPDDDDDKVEVEMYLLAHNAPSSP